MLNFFDISDSDSESGSLTSDHSGVSDDYCKVVYQFDVHSTLQSLHADIL